MAFSAASSFLAIPLINCVAVVALLLGFFSLELDELDELDDDEVVEVVDN